MEPIGRLIKSEEIQEGKTRCPGAQEENRGKEAGAKARARSDSSDNSAASSNAGIADGKFRRQDRRSIDTTTAPASEAAWPTIATTAARVGLPENWPSQA